VAVRIPATMSNHRHHSRRDDRTSTTSTPRRHSTRLYRSVIIRHHLFTASARGLCIHRRLFVSLFVCKQDCAKTTQLIFVKFGGKVAHGTRKRRLDFEVNPEHVVLGLVLRLADAGDSASDTHYDCATVGLGPTHTTQHWVSLCLPDVC